MVMAHRELGESERARREPQLLRQAAGSSGQAADRKAANAVAIAFLTRRARFPLQHHLRNPAMARCPPRAGR